MNPAIKERIVVDDNGCWLWRRNVGTSGYGMKYLSGGTRKRQVAHRWVYEQMVGSVPDGLVLDHLCRVRRCVNPDHLEPVTQRENNRRGVGYSGLNAQKTHCINGHEFNEANTYSVPSRPGGRACRACDRELKQRKRDLLRDAC